MGVGKGMTKGEREGEMTEKGSSTSPTERKVFGESDLQARDGRRNHPVGFCPHVFGELDEPMGKVVL